MNKIVKDILEYIEDNLDGDLNLDKIAGQLCYTKYHINRLFSQETGSTIYKYIQTRRLSEAASKLAETKKPIVDIAYEAHYGSQQAFTQAFGRVYMCSPQAYRRLHSGRADMMIQRFGRMDRAAGASSFTGCLGGGIAA